MLTHSALAITLLFAMSSCFLFERNKANNQQRTEIGQSTTIKSTPFSQRVIAEKRHTFYLNGEARVRHRDGLFHPLLITSGDNVIVEVFEKSLSGKELTESHSSVIYLVLPKDIRIGDSINLKAVSRPIAEQTQPYGESIMAMKPGEISVARYAPESVSTLNHTKIHRARLKINDITAEKVVVHLDYFMEMSDGVMAIFDESLQLGVIDKKHF